MFKMFVKRCCLYFLTYSLREFLKVRSSQLDDTVVGMRNLELTATDVGEEEIHTTELTRFLQVAFFQIRS